MPEISFFRFVWKSLLMFLNWIFLIIIIRSCPKLGTSRTMGGQFLELNPYVCFLLILVYLKIPELSNSFNELFGFSKKIYFIILPWWNRNIFVWVVHIELFHVVQWKFYNKERLLITEKQKRRGKGKWYGTKLLFL